MRDQLLIEYQDHSEVDDIAGGKPQEGSAVVIPKLTDVDFADEIEDVQIKTTGPRTNFKPTWEPASSEMIRDWRERRGIEIQLRETGFQADESQSRQHLLFSINEHRCRVQGVHRDWDLGFIAEANLDDVRIAGNKLRIGNTIIANRRGK